MEEKQDLKQLKMDLESGNYRCIGSGSGRRVFDIDSEYVVKVAKNKKGKAQNLVEKNIWEATQSNLLAEVSRISDDYKLLFMAKAEEIESMTYVREYFHVKNNRELFQLEDLKEIVRNYHLMLEDLCKKTSWGIINSRPVIIDYGYTVEVRRKYYSIF